jgi:hypothetical protein
MDRSCYLVALKYAPGMWQHLMTYPGAADPAISPPAATATGTAAAAGFGTCLRARCMDRPANLINRKSRKITARPFSLKIIFSINKFLIYNLMKNYLDFKARQPQAAMTDGGAAARLRSRP